MNKKIVISALMLTLFSACSSDENVKPEAYEFSNTLRMLDMPPDLKATNSNLVMEIPRPSIKACEKLYEADGRYQVEKARKDAREKAEQERLKAEKPNDAI